MPGSNEQEAAAVGMLWQCHRGGLWRGDGLAVWQRPSDPETLGCLLTVRLAHLMWVAAGHTLASEALG